jgi:hypothetical protein
MTRETAYIAYYRRLEAMASQGKETCGLSPFDVDSIKWAISQIEFTGKHAADQTTMKPPSTVDVYMNRLQTLLDNQSNEDYCEALRWAIMTLELKAESRTRTPAQQAVVSMFDQVTLLMIEQTIKNYAGRTHFDEQFCQDTGSDATENAMAIMIGVKSRLVELTQSVTG